MMKRVNTSKILKVHGARDIYCCAPFGLSGDISMQVIGVGFIVGVIQDSCETALNSSTDVLFTAATEIREARKHGKEMKLNI